MQERLITLACAVAALALFYVLFTPKSLHDSAVSRPLSTDARSEGYLAARRWLESSGLQIVSLRERYEHLSTEGNELAPTGNLLIVTLPQRFPARYLERLELWQWIEAGNTLLVLAALSDRAQWNAPLQTGFRTQEALLELTGIAVVPVEIVEGDPVLRLDPRHRLSRPQHIELAPNGAHPLFEGVGRFAAESTYPAGRWRAVVPEDGFLLTLARVQGEAGEAFWQRRLGAGHVLVSAYASLFTNRMLGEPDHAHLLANIVARSLGPDGAVIFDDMHQGDSALYHPEAFFSDRRLHATIAVLLGLWFLWALGATRLRASSPAAPAPGEGALVRAAGGFLARVLRPVDVGRRLMTLCFNDLNRRLGAPEDGQPPWVWLARQTALDRRDLAELRATHARLAAGKRVNLEGLHSLTLRIRKQVL